MLELELEQQLEIVTEIELPERRVCPCAVVIVTHNSQNVIAKTMNCLSAQTVTPEAVSIIDSGSTSLDYLKPFEEIATLVSIPENIGLCRANNMALEALLEAHEYVVFLNSDVFLLPWSLEYCWDVLQDSAYSNVAGVSGLLLGYDLAQDCATGFVDSAGIFPKWYGQWYDRDRGKMYIPEHYQTREYVPAVCGAFMFCRAKALQSALLRDKEVFDEQFFMWKDDVELSLRIRAKGWRWLFDPSIIAYHSRGGEKNAKKSPHHMPLMAARNEMRIHWRYSKRYLPYACLKWAGVALRRGLLG